MDSCHMLALLDNPSRDQHIIAPAWSQLHLGNTRGWEGGVSQMIKPDAFIHCKLLNKHPQGSC